MKGVINCGNHLFTWPSARQIGDGSKSLWHQPSHRARDASLTNCGHGARNWATFRCTITPAGCYDLVGRAAELFTTRDLLGEAGIAFSRGSVRGPRVRHAADCSAA